jgi:hypothetical protein
MGNWQACVLLGCNCMNSLAGQWHGWSLGQPMDAYMGSNQAEGSRMRTAHGWHGSCLQPMDRPAWLPLGHICRMSVCYPTKGDFGQGLGCKWWLGQCVPWTSDEDCPGDAQVRPWCTLRIFVTWMDQELRPLQVPTPGSISVTQHNHNNSTV